MQKIIHMEFESDDDVAEQLKNANDAKTEKVRVTKKTVHYYEFSSEEEEGEHADPKNQENTRWPREYKQKR